MTGPGADRVGCRFYVGGEYAGCLVPGRDPAEQDWQPFAMADLHPAGADALTVWRDGRMPPATCKCEAIEQARLVVDWMRGERGWEGFNGGLWLERGLPATPERVYRWELV